MQDEAWKEINIPSSLLASLCSEAPYLVSTSARPLRKYFDFQQFLKARPHSRHGLAPITHMFNTLPQVAYAPLQKGFWTTVGIA